MSVAQPEVRRLSVAPAARLARWAAAGALMGYAIAVTVATAPPPLAPTLGAGLAVVALLGLALARFDAIVVLGFALFGIVSVEPAPPDLVFGVAIAVAVATGRLSLGRAP